MGPFRWLRVAVMLGDLLGLLVGRSDGQAPLTFEKDVRPLLKSYCLDCHGGGEKLQGNLDLRLKRFAEKGGESGPAIVAGKPDASLMLQRIRAGEMPPGEKKKLPADKIALIQRWIAEGAKTQRDEPQQLPPGIDITPQERAHWAYQPIRRLAPAHFTLADQARTPIDAFILAKLHTKGLSFAADADKRTLIRRAAFDLIGLPPSLPDIDAFLADDTEQAYEKMIDRLLDSLHYGERWARHWLDVAGYADSEGNGNEDTPRPFAYKYRDYVIRSLNADKPLDQFIVEQLAGDELTPPPWSNLNAEQIERLSATGFLRNAADLTATGGGDEAAAANQVMTDTLKIVGSSLLGLTVGCAQCHDHRYDPIPQSDYYRLRAVFEPALDPAHWRRPGQRLVSLFLDADRAKSATIEGQAQVLQQAFNMKQQKCLLAALEKELLKHPEALRGKLRDAYVTAADKRTPEQKQLLAANPSVNISPGVLYQYDAAAADELKKDQAKINAKRAEKPIEDFLSVLNEMPGTPPVTRVFHRGDHRQPTQAVKPGDLTIAAAEGARLEINEKNSTLPTSGRRLAFARHLTSGHHPLLGRVLANRIWLHHFGRGIVETPSDFGTLGTPPTHPELLDWLADELVRQGWSLKRMHKLIMCSTVYRQSSRRAAAKTALDAENAWYGRYSLRRLDAESMRDTVLAASGRLDRRPFGPPVPIEEDYVGQVLARDDQPRRSIYVQVRRTKPVSFLTTFDAPVMTVNCERRSSSTAAPQSLMLMNSDFMLKHAGRFAERVRQEAPREPTQELFTSVSGKTSTLNAALSRQIALAWRIAYQRALTAGELEAVGRFLKSQIDHARAAGAKDPESAAMSNLCQQLLSSNEFLYVD